MRFFTASLALASLSAASTITRRAGTTYSLSDDYSSPSAFFSNFTFFTGADPTQGFVQFKSQKDAFASNLAGRSSTDPNASIYLGVDYKNPAPQGRASLRVQSSKTYNVGNLIILDLAHMPGGICGVWPAFWLVGPDWPTTGEIDVIEGVNNAAADSTTLHTGPGCSMLPQNNSAYSGPRYSGTLHTDNCDVNAAGQATNTGCGIQSSDTSSYGTGFNAVGGGVYAVEWTTTGISVWHFARGKVPADITSQSTTPDPSGWGTPAAAFASQNCDMSSMFTNQQIVFDTTFCGSWAGAVWSTNPQCMALASTCEDYVHTQPAAFREAYWEINSLKVFAAAA